MVKREPFMQGVNDFKTLEPDLASEWDYAKNREEHREDPSWPERPEQVRMCDCRHCWWICAKGHRFLSTVHRRAGGIGCRWCMVTANGSLRDLFPDLCLEWDAKKNLEAHLDDDKWPAIPSKVSAGSAKMAWWRCSTCGFSWKARIAHRAYDGSQCPRCAADQRRSTPTKKSSKGRNKLIKGRNDAATLYPKLSFVWDENANLKAHAHNLRHAAVLSECLPGTTLFIPYWECNECGAHWQARISSLIRSYDSWTMPCPKCSLIASYKHGVVSDYPEAADWDYDANYNEAKRRGKNVDLDSFINGVDPQFTPAAGNVGVHWKCHICGNKWTTSSARRCMTHQRCPNCARLSGGTIADYPDLVAEWDYEKNAAEHEVDPTFPRLPSEISRGAGRGVWWRCNDCGHVWMASPNGRTDKARRKGCPRCAVMRRRNGQSRLEDGVFEFIHKKWPGLEIRRRDREIVPPKEIDIFLPSLSRGIEVNGDFWHNDLDGGHDREDHIIKKIEACSDKGIKLAIVWESDWNERRDQIARELTSFVDDGFIGDLLSKTSNREAMPDRYKQAI